MRFRLVAIATLLLASGSALAESFRFELASDPIIGQATGSKVDGEVQMDFSAGPAGAVFDVSSSGLGLNSRAITGVSDPEVDKFNLLTGASDPSESFSFSFDKPGVITTLDFDGVKDESFEFFRLELPSGEILSIFDSQIGLRLVDLSLINEPNVTLLTEEGAADDDLFGLSIPFQAGEVFTLTYDEYTPDPSNYQPGFTPETGNGARFQGLTIATIPEPTALSATLVALAVASGISRRLRRSA